MARLRVYATPHYGWARASPKAQTSKVHNTSVIRFLSAIPRISVFSTASGVHISSVSSFFSELLALFHSVASSLSPRGRKKYGVPGFQLIRNSSEHPVPSNRIATSSPACGRRRERNAGSCDRGKSNPGLHTLQAADRL